jgi:methylated-DNA-[protein]-cysteine S-methyltransferase
MFSKMQIPSPIGPIVVASRGTSLCALVFADHWEKEAANLERRFGEIVWDGVFPERLAASLHAYFGGDLEAIDAIPVDVGGTPFQASVWKALRTIPAGETISYAELARRAGAPAAIRAAGNANGRNPVAVVIPCHRVIHNDGSIGGYGGGLDRKRWLLSHERAPLGDRQLLMPTTSA